MHIEYTIGITLQVKRGKNKERWESWLRLKKQHAFQHLEGGQYHSQSFYEKRDQERSGGKVEKVVEANEKKREYS